MDAETWISVDVETSGPTPGTGSLVAIGACLVYRPDEGIEILVRPDPALPWRVDAEVIHGLGRERLERDGLEPKEAIERLAAWLERVVPPGSRPVFVAFNAPFDWMFVADYAWRYLGRNPFGISALDLKALYLGRHLESVERWAETTRERVRERYPIALPHTHRALDDAREQAAICRRIRDGARPQPRRSSHMPPIDLGRFDVLTFDCYGTLIDWEAGLTAAIRRVLDPRGVEAGDDDLLERFADHEAAVEAGEYRPYRHVLARTLRGICGDLGVEPSEAEVEAFAGSVGDWPAFPDTVDALESLAGRFRLGIITNCDDDLFAATSRRLGVTFDWVVTAQQVGAYKPSPRPFEVALGRIGLPRERILHVAQSLFHDHVPARRLGLATAWVDRRGDRPGGGATPPASATPDLVVPDLATLARLVTAGPEG